MWKGYKMKRYGKVLEILNEFEKMGIPSVDCVIYHKGECVFRHQAGFSDEERTKPIDGSERYNIYSCSKPITCTAALQLVEKGLIGLDTPVSEYLPEFRQLKKTIDGKTGDVKNIMTVRHLFTMSGGLTYNVTSKNIRLGQKETNGVMQTRAAMKYLAKDPLIFEPGERFEYSLCHDVLAAVAETVSGMTFGEYVKRNIFDPCGMKHTTFLLPEEELKEIAAQYRYDEAAKKFDPVGPQIQHYKLGSAYESGGAGCVSSVDDYIRFLECLRTGKLLRQETLELMQTPQINDTNPADYAYGLGVRCPSTGSSLQDFGWGGAAGAFLAVLPQAEATIFHAQHVLCSPNQPMRINLVNAFLKDL